MYRRLLLATCALSAVSFSAVGAFAQSAPATGAAPTAAAPSDTTIGELVVTAQRREENLQDTPIAVSAFSGDTLKNEKLEGGNDLLLQIPNSNFTRTNFGSFNFKLRGVGTDVIGAGGTQGVSINENELPVTSNHFADTDFFDVDRVEVLRGPQGTLYGRNATGGAVDLITTQPKSQFGGFAAIQYGNYNQIKATGAVNIPLGDMFAVRVAGVRLVNDGFGQNTYLGARVDGRDLGAGRVTLSFKPSDRFSAYLLYEHFGEDDTRNRVGKQLCIKDPGPTSVGGVPIAPAGGPVSRNYAAFLNQGCIAGSLNQPAAFGTLNSNGTLAGTLANISGLNNGTDLFGANPLQDRNLHNIQSAIQPRYTAQEDLVDLHMAWNVTDNLTLTSITGFNRDVGTSQEDYNRVVPNLPYTPVEHRPVQRQPADRRPRGSGHRHRRGPAAVPRRRGSRSADGRVEPGDQLRRHDQLQQGIHPGAAADLVVQGPAQLLGRRLLFGDHLAVQQRHQLLRREQCAHRLCAGEQRRWPGADRHRSEQSGDGRGPQLLQLADRAAATSSRTRASVKSTTTSRPA